MTQKLFVAARPDDLTEVAAWLSEIRKDFPVMAFYGPMGAGKTTLIKAFCRFENITDEVNSPTFSLVNEYLTQEGESFFHFDFYRIEKLEEAFDIGYENYFYSGNCCLIEWPEKIMQLLPENHVKIDIQPDEHSGVRTISCRLITAV
ncbi:MAG: tRNA (adenosine(37)-N6)-threonylcarbamoyltransferase complex ATPase subunit type 1 TsaE [Bacteroidales bacterium]|nr:tRNA (adenosine(37)-N6)-threonylcarbamoyltransferase complex ATPase subunit type 1 TsaE [Bacteroidales bacterium]